MIDNNWNIWKGEYLILVFIYGFPFWSFFFLGNYYLTNVNFRIWWLLIFYIFSNNWHQLNPMLNHMKYITPRELDSRKHSTLILQKYEEDKVSNFQEN